MIQRCAEPGCGKRAWPFLRGSKGHLGHILTHLFSLAENPWPYGDRAVAYFCFEHSKDFGP